MLLLVGAVIGISVSAAENDPTVEITAKNISYEGAVKTLYIVETANADGLTVQVNFYDTDPAKGGALLYTKGVGGQITLGETECDVVFSNGFAPNELRNSIFVVPTLVDANGAVVATGATVEYSPYIYAMNRFNKAATADQLALYTALLDYGAAVQRVLNTPDEVKALGGYADEYYEIDAKYTIAHDMSTKYKLKAGTFSKASIDAGKIYAGDTYDVFGFAAWANAEGDIISLGNQQLTSNDVNPGKNTLLALYGRYDTVRTRSDDFTDGNNFEFNTYNIGTVGNGMKTKFAYEGVTGNSSLIDADGVVTYTKLPVSPETLGEGQNAADANYQYFKIWAGYAKQDVYTYESDIKFTNIKGTQNFHLVFEGYDNGYKNMHNVVIKPSEELDENGYAVSLSLGNATLLNDTNYKIRAEWYNGADVMKVFVDDVLVYSYEASAPINFDDSFSNFKFVADQYVEGVVTFDNIDIKSVCIHSAHKEDTQVEGAYLGDHYFKAICTECNTPNPDLLYQVTDNKGNGKYFTDSTACGAKVDIGVDTAIKINEKDGGTAIIHGVAEDGTYTVETTAWDFITIIPGTNPVELANGETLIYEFDIMYDALVAHNATDFEQYGDYIFFGLTSAANGSNNSGMLNGNGSQLSFYDNYVKYNNGGIFALDVWHNIRFEYTIAEDGATATYKVFIDNNETPAYEKTNDFVYTTVYGLLIQGSRGHEIIKLDNFFMGKKDNACEFAVDTDNPNAYLGNGVFATSCNKCGSRGTETVTVDVNENLGKGEYYTNADLTAGKADVDNVKPTVTWGKNNGELTYELSNGTMNVTSKSWARFSVASQSAITLAAGEKYVQEFDFMYDAARNLTPGERGRLYFGLTQNATGDNNSMVGTASDSMYFYENYAIYAIESEKKATNNGIKMYADIWYNIRFEYSISADGTTETYEVYINGELNSTFTDTTPATTIVGILMQPSRGEVKTNEHDFKLDNFYMGKLCSEHTYEDVEFSGTNFAGLNEAGNATFYARKCSNCGNFDTNAVEYAGVALGQGTYYADETKAGRREDYENITVGTNFGQALNGTNAPASTACYSIRTFGENKTLSLGANGWTTAAIRPKDATRVAFATGDKLVMEFDIRINESAHADGTAAKFNFANTYKTSDSKQVSDQVEIRVAANGKDTTIGSATLVKSVWYNVRFELIVGGDLNVYVNGELAYTKSGYSYAWSEMAWYGLGVVTRGTLDMDIDNMYMANLNEAAE